MEIIMPQARGVPVVGIPTVNDGWDFWSRVYEDPELRQQISQKSQNGPTVSELLRSEELCRGELIFLNVPRIGTGQQAVVRSLLCSQIGRNLPLLDIVITNRRWKIRFYRYDDAQEVQRRFDGYRFKHKHLIVRFATKADGVLSDYPLIMGKLHKCSPVIVNPHPVSPEKSYSSNVPTLKIAVNEEIDDTEAAPQMASYEPRVLDASWTPVEMNELDNFKRELITVLRRMPDGMYTVAAIDELKQNVRRKGVVAVALESWPYGLLRMCSPCVKMTGKYLSLHEQDNHKALLTKTAHEGAARVPSDEWEPMPPSNVRNEYHMVDYMTAFLTYFGPQHIKVDVPLRLLARTLPGTWPAGAIDLARMCLSLSPSFVLFDDVLYLATNVRHRRLLLDQLQPSKPRIGLSARMSHDFHHNDDDH